MKSKTTMKSIAEELGVSVSTVSKALKDNPRISKETRKKIQAFSKLLNYQPDARAINLRKNISKVIGVVIPEITNHFFTTVIKGIDYMTKKRGYQVMICLSNESYIEEVKNIKLLTSGSVDGLLISISSGTQKKGNYDHLFNIKNNQLPMVLFDRTEDFIACDMVKADDIGGAYNATKTLIESGCKRIALINFKPYINIGKERRMGYCMALDEYGIKENNSLIFEVDEEKDLFKQIEKVFNLNPLPDAIFAVKEDFAAIAIKLALKKGLKIPEDISLISFVNGLISEYSSPSITAVIQHGYNMGKMAAELLIDRIENKTSKKPYETKVIATRLKHRDSTKKVN